MIKKIEGMHSESHLRYSRALFVFCNFNTDVAVAVLGSFAFKRPLTAATPQKNCMGTGWCKVLIEI